MATTWAPAGRVTDRPQVWDITQAAGTDLMKSTNSAVGRGLLYLSVLLSVAGCGRGSGNPGAESKPALTVSLVSPAVAEWPEVVAGTGSVDAWQESIVGAEIGGLPLDDVLVDVGDRVSKGQVLARFRDESVRVDIAQAEAAVAEAEAALAFAREQAERARGLAETRVVSPEHLAQQVASERAGIARLSAAAARLEAQRLRMKQAMVVAPDDGVISSRAATVGAVVGTGSELFRMIRQNRLEWRGTLPADELARVVVGQRVVVEARGQGSVIGTVRAVSPVIDAATLMGLLYVDLPEPGVLRAGMFAAGVVEIGTAPALHVPESSIVYRDGFQYVMKVDDERRVRQMKVVPGRRRGLQVEITEGLSGGDRIVASGGSFLEEGDLVVIAEPDRSLKSGESTVALQGGGRR
ncbi:MAG: efflux RND transporter periplasmic adaptor subunit [Opitutaceae bacterium]|nr:efflux RND transporter periplasmic adaptor subunit [Opitutaceae bacterium]